MESHDCHDSKPWRGVGVGNERGGPGRRQGGGQGTRVMQQGHRLVRTINWTVPLYAWSLVTAVESRAHTGISVSASLPQRRTPTVSYKALLCPDIDSWRSPVRSRALPWRRRASFRPPRRRRTPAGSAAARSRRRCPGLQEGIKRRQPGHEKHRATATQCSAGGARWLRCFLANVAAM